jgi:hypothetical protein
MRPILVAFLLVVSIVSVASVASAELLTTANPIGQGKWAVLGAGLSDANVRNTSGWSMTTLAGYVGYGATDKLDVYLTGGSVTVNGLPATVTMSMTALGLNGKYLVMAEGASMPVSVSVGAGYKSLNVTASAGAGGNTTGSQIMVGVGVSKVMAPFVPYGGLAYRSNASGGTTASTQLDLTVGSAIAWSTQGAVFAEYTLQSITPNGGTAYSSGQIGIGVGYAL